MTILYAFYGCITILISVLPLIFNSSSHFSRFLSTVQCLQQHLVSQSPLCLNAFSALRQSSGICLTLTFPSLDNKFISSFLSRLGLVLWHIPIWKVLCVVWWLVPHDFWYLGGIRRRQYWRITVSSKTNFGRNTDNARLLIFVRLYHFS